MAIRRVDAPSANGAEPLPLIVEERSDPATLYGNCVELVPTLRRHQTSPD